MINVEYITVTGVTEFFIYNASIVITLLVTS